MIRLVLMSLVGLAACAPDAVPPKAWNLGNFGEAGRNFGGFDSNYFVTPVDSAQFPHLVDNVRKGVTVFPAFEEGQSVALVVTEIWSNWPTPWIEPVYKSGEVVFFAVNRKSSFYSPFWSLVLLPDGLTTIEQVTRASAESKVDLVNAIYCPLTVPGLTELASSVVPMTGLPIDAIPKATDVVVAGETELQQYFDFGADRFGREGSRPIETPLYVFVDAQQKALPLPFVVPSNAARQSFWRRIEVRIPETAAVVVAKARAGAFRPLLGNVTVIEQPDTERSAPVRLLRDQGCLRNGVVTATCEFLDSESAIVKLPEASRKRTETTLAAGRLGAK